MPSRFPLASFFFLLPVSVFVRAPPAAASRPPSLRGFSVSPKISSPTRHPHSATFVPHQSRHPPPHHTNTPFYDRLRCISSCLLPPPVHVWVSASWDGMRRRPCSARTQTTPPSTLQEAAGALCAIFTTNAPKNSIFGYFLYQPAMQQPLIFLIHI